MEDKKDIQEKGYTNGELLNYWTQICCKTCTSAKAELLRVHQEKGLIEIRCGHCGLINFYGLALVAQNEAKKMNVIKQDRSYVA